MRVQGKVDHYNVVFDQFEDAMNELLWNICQGNKQPLPGSFSHWRTRLEYQKAVDDVLPIDAPLLDTSVPHVVAQFQSCLTSPYLQSLELPLARLVRQSHSLKCPYRPVPWATSTPESRPLSRCKPGL